MVSTTKKIHSIDELRFLVAPVAERYGAGKVYLFGSVARGDFDDDSDYDFCIELGRIRGSALGGFFLDLKEAVGNEIDLVETGSVGPELMEKIAREGVLLYGE